MSLEELSFMNYFYDPFYKEEESFNILNPLQNDNSFLDNQPYEIIPLFKTPLNMKIS